MSIVKKEKTVLFAGDMGHFEQMKEWMSREGHTLEDVKVVKKGNDLLVYKR